MRCNLSPLCLTFILLLFLVLTLSAPAAAYTYPFRVSGESILDASNTTVQFRCANWPGHLETMLPEGLQWLPLKALVRLLVDSSAFNCIRLTYSVELFYRGSNLTARQSLQSLSLPTVVTQMETANPELLDLPLLSVRDAVVLACQAAGVFILMDNQMSTSEWCCSNDDGNGWWNDRFFNVTEWLHSLQAISAHYAAFAPNAVAFSLRNELRTDKSREEQVTDWLQYVPQGIDALHRGNPDALIFVSGLNYDTDWTFLSSTSGYNDSLWQAALTERAAHLVFETHVYSWDGYQWAANCTSVLQQMDAQMGLPSLTLHRPHVLTEMGLDQDKYPREPSEFLYFQCMSQWILSHRLGWGIWLFGGSYYVRNGKPDEGDNFGVVYANFTGYKSQQFLTALRKIEWREEKADTVTSQ